MTRKQFQLSGIQSGHTAVKSLMFEGATTNNDLQKFLKKSKKRFLAPFCDPSLTTIEIDINFRIADVTPTSL